MADLILLQPGSPPWEPLGSELIRVFHRYNVPLAGIVAQGGHEYLFRCVAGEVEPYGVWSYALLEPGEADELEAVAVENRGAAIDTLADSRSGALAVAIDTGGGLGIVLSCEHEAGHSGLVHGLEDLQRRLDQFVETLQKGGDALASSCV